MDGCLASDFIKLSQRNYTVQVQVACTLRALGCQLNAQHVLDMPLSPPHDKCPGTREINKRNKDRDRTSGVLLNSSANIRTKKIVYVFSAVFCLYKIIGYTQVAENRVKVQTILTLS